MNEEHLKIFNSGLPQFNMWRNANSHITVDLSCTNFSGMNLDEINFNEALLQNATFENTSLIGADLSRANLSNCNFTGADLRMAKLDGAVASNAKFNNANLSKAYLRLGFFDGSDFTGANLSSASLRHSSMNGAIIKKTNATNAGFFGVDLFKAKASDSALGGAHLPKDYRVHRTARQLTGVAVWGLNLLILLVIFFFTSQYYNKATKKYGDPGVVIGSFMEYAMGNMYISQDKYDKAIIHYKTAIKKNPKEAIYYYKLSYAYMLKKDYDKAEENYKIFEKLKPAKMKQATEIDVWMRERKKNSY